jgi:hypothetical protein
MFVHLIAYSNRTRFAEHSTGHATGQRYRNREVLCQNAQISPCLLGLVWDGCMVFLRTLYEFRTLAVTMPFDIPGQMSQAGGELTAKFPLSC